LLAWHLARLVGWQIPVRSPKLVASGGHLGPHRGPFPEELVGPEQSLLLVETVTGVVCGGFADSAWVLDAPAKDGLSSTYFVLEHPSGETRKWTKTGEDARYATAREPVPFIGFGGLIICARGVILASAGAELSEEDAVFICGGTQTRGAIMAEILRWEFWHL
jgi:hypothetical protein